MLEGKILWNQSIETLILKKSFTPRGKNFVQCKNHTVLQDSKQAAPKKEQEELWLQSAKWPSRQQKIQKKIIKASIMSHFPSLLFHKIHIKYFPSTKTHWGTLENSISNISIGAKLLPSSHRIAVLYFCSSRSPVLLHLQQNKSCNQYFTSVW